MLEAKLISAESLRRFGIAALVQVGMSEGDAATVAEVQVNADLRGVHTHGISSIPGYCDRIKRGGTNPKARPAIVQEGPAYALIDADNAQGQVSGVRAMSVCIEKATRSGVAVASVRNSNHYGMGAYYAMMALKQDLIGLCTTNGGNLIPPWGGVRPTFGNNPLSVAVPAGARHPVVLDIAMSVVAGGKVGLTVAEGKPIPPGWILDREGRPTTDPAAARDALLVPIGEYKGYGLTMVMETLAAVLSGARFALQQDRAWSRDASRPGERGHFFLAINPAMFMPIADFKARVDQMI
ncbi:MAG: Ldh family oxidoreductase, partial [Chloroflexi bacterium]|nr:Ldh family oxidoreductase [Chloroflexota bacterium]